MALTVKHNRASHTHENEQFRRVASSLKILFKQKGWSGLLIGNPFNEKYSRFKADAILLSYDGFFIIDFKDYSGTLKLPGNKNEFEMTQWYTESDEDKKRTLIKAGNKFINPFQQLNSYREAFKEIVKTEIILSGLIHETKTCAINIFSGPLTIQNSVPKEKLFYKIIQESYFEHFLYDYSSENKYSKETANVLTNIFNAKDWPEHIELSNAKEGKIIKEKRMTKSEAINMAREKFLTSLDNSNTLFSNINAAQDVWWLEPSNIKFASDLYFVLNNEKTQTLYIFKLPANTIRNAGSYFHQRNDKVKTNASDIYISVSGIKFCDKKGFDFSKYRIDEIEY